MSESLQFSFSEEAKAIFGFLSKYGFSCESAGSNNVRFESTGVYIEIAYGESDGEVSISFGRLAEKEEFSFTLFLRAENPELEKALGDRLADNPDEIRDNLVRLANALEKEGRSILNCEDTMFEKMKSVRWWDFQPEALVSK